jgi:hypothetical protein
MSSVRSRKSKGRKLQNYIRDIFRSIFKEQLELEDIESRQMGGAGTDIVLTPAAKKIIPFDIECKNQEKFNLNSAMKQAVDNAKPDRIPLVVFTKNKDNIYVSLTLNDLLKLLYPDWYSKVDLKNKFSINSTDLYEEVQK